MLPFQNKITLVTGSGRGIGRAIALDLCSSRGVPGDRQLLPQPASPRLSKPQPKSTARGGLCLVVWANVGEIDVHREGYSWQVHI